MKQLTTARNRIGTAQDLRPVTPIGTYRKRRHFMNRLNRRVIISAAVLVSGLAMASPVLAGPRPATAHYTFTTVDFPGSIYTDLLGFTPETMVGQFIDTGGSTHGWLFSEEGGAFQQFDVPGAWMTTLSAIDHSGTFGGVYRDDSAHPARRHGFIVAGNVLTTIDYPGSTRTTVVQMNDR